MAKFGDHFPLHFGAGAGPGPGPEPPLPPGTPETIDGESLIMAAEVYASLEPITSSDAANGYPLRALVRAIGSMFRQPEEAIRAIGDGLDSWERVFDPDRAPTWLLPFVGQSVGVLVDTTRTREGQIAQIKEEGGWKRGRPATVIAAISAVLTGSKTVRLVERSSSPYRALIITRPAESPVEPALELAAKSQKPGGMIFDLQETNLPLIDEGTKTIDASTGNIDTATLADIT